MPDVALGSETSANGSLSASVAATQAASAATTSALAEENSAIRKQLTEAIEKYEQETGKKYTRSTTSNSTLNDSSSANLNLQAAYKLAVTVAELGGRSQQVLLAREFLYRLCEARANRFFVDDQAYVDLQIKALTMIESIASTQTPSREAELAVLLGKIIEANAQILQPCTDGFAVCQKKAADDGARKACLDENTKCRAQVHIIDATQVVSASPASGKRSAAGPQGPQINIISPLDKDTSLRLTPEGSMVPFTAPVPPKREDGPANLPGPTQRP